MNADGNDDHAHSAALATDVRLHRMEASLNNFRRHARLRDVTLPQNITEAHLLRTETAKTEEYAEVARIYRHYREVALVPEWPQSCVAVARRVLPLPGCAGSENEWWIELGACLLRT